MKTRSNFQTKHLVYIALSIVIAAVYLMPLYVLVNMSFRTIQDTYSKLVFPKIINIGNYLAVFNNNDLWVGFRNSIINVFLTVVIEISFSAMAAYGLVRSNSRAAIFIDKISMSIMMIPAVALLVGTYSLMVSVGLVNKLSGLSFLLAAGGIPASIYLFSNFIKTIPVALDEAATIDGAGVLRTFYSVIFPQLKAITITRIIIVAVGCWNQYLFPMYLLQTKDKHTVILVIKAAFNSFNGVINVPRASATCVIGILPIIVLYLALQKYVIGGQLDSAVK